MTVEQIRHHWQPVMPSAHLGRQPKAVTLDGMTYVLFRPDKNSVAALPDRCPHRGMRLSAGRVCQGRIECPYHGWRFSANGCGSSPGEPERKPRLRPLVVTEAANAIWISKDPGDSTPPDPAAGCDRLLGVIADEFPAALPLVVDNFTEVEHTATTHGLLGYPVERLAEVKVSVETDQETVRVINTGPQKPVPLWGRLLFGIRGGDIFIDDWTTRFTPVHSVFDHHWRCPDHGHERGDRLRTTVYYSAVASDRTRVIAFVAASGPRIRSPLSRWLGRLALRSVAYEIGLDRKMVSRLHERHKAVPFQPTRFDQHLIEQRRRLASLPAANESDQT